MRIKSFEVRNYKGLAMAALSDLDREPVVTISGRNGTGKSLVLEAVVSAWSSRYNMSSRVGPWGDELTIAIDVSYTDDEWRVIDEWHARYHGGGQAPRDSSMEVTWNRAGHSRNSPPVAIQIARDSAFQRESAFGIIDFLSANRLVASAPTPTVDLAMFAHERVEQDRNTMQDQFIEHRTAMALPPVSNYLVTLDYQSFLAERQHLPIDNEYEAIATAFGSATGKTLLAPQYDPVKGSDIEVAIAGGHKHKLNALSSGEQEMIAMMYFVRRLSAAGGILCIDEPEQHLHPTLQAAVFDSMSGLSARAQVLVVSHSASIIASSPIGGLAELAAPIGSTTNQLTRLGDHPERTKLVAELGVTASDLAQNDLLLVVEGETDSQWLRMIFPVELGRTHVMIAGSGQQVLDAHDTLLKVPSVIPWICVRDRDLMTDDEVATLRAKHPNLFIWQRRAIESTFIDPVLIAQVYESVGVSHSEAQVATWLKSAADPMREDVLESLVERELARLVPAPGKQDGARFPRMESQLREYSKMNADRADLLVATLESQRTLLDARWEADWPILVNPKTLLAAFLPLAGVFKSYPDLVSALAARVRTDDALRPAPIQGLKKRLEALLAR